MKLVADIRRENLDRLAAEVGSMDKLAEISGVSPVYLSQIRTQAVDMKTGKPRQMGNQVARKLEVGCTKSAGWMDTDHSIQDVLSSDVGDPITLKASRRLPVVGEVKGGDDGYLEELQYPIGHGEGYIEYPSTDPNAYALRVRGDSMHPRYRAGEFAVVEPGIEPQEGDDVLVVCVNGKKMLKQFNWRRDGEYQFVSINNGYEPITMPAKDIISIQLVAGRARRNAISLYSN